MQKIEELPKWIYEFFEFGENKPINRLAYTEEDIEYKVRIMKKMQELGMSITLDPIGNICGTLMGEDADRTVLAMCSHTDSVPDGGQYDGCLGVVSALASVEQLVKSGQNPRGNVKVVVCACEESSRFNLACIGSKYLAEKLGKDKLRLQDTKGVTLKESIESGYSYLEKLAKQYGLDKSGISKVSKVLGIEEAENALELHIEQAQVLHDSEHEIGVVNSIVAPYRFRARIAGQEGHSGSTPMEERKDAVHAGSVFEVMLNNIACRQNSNLRITVPDVKVTSVPSMNVIAKSAEMLVDCRLQYPNKAQDIKKRVENAIRKVEELTGVAFEIELLASDDPVKMNKALLKSLLNSSNACGKKSVTMQSWAGHDIAYLPAQSRGLIFVPSTGGSHNKGENTTERDVINGIQVLTEALRDITLAREPEQSKRAAPSFEGE